MYCLKTGGKRAGFAALESAGKDLTLETLSVSPEYHHRGFGKALLDFAKRETVKHGAERLVVGIIEENAVLKDWYARNGFVHTGTQVFSHLPFTVGFTEWRPAKK